MTTGLRTSASGHDTDHRTTAPDPVAPSMTIGPRTTAPDPVAPSMTIDTHTAASLTPSRVPRSGTT
ncbi:hypothetical protein [Nakamurella deserti]|uniref:hypothetical protein n=1 Tax=Nakamurella deserti TaxID=2164074 RepID=UPI000DBE4349|nr:hypothetical protein [Nakamurella deserti]